MDSASEHEQTIVLNPVSGSGDHVDSVRDRAALEAYRLEQTEGAGDGITLAREAAERGATLIAAAGGDGTLNEVVRGVAAADALDRVTVGVIPVGTGNNFAEQIGVTNIDHAFGVLESGERRQIDLGRADGELFVNSCISGLTADASGQTDPESKSRLGVVAYVLETLQSVTEFEGLRLSVDLEGGTAGPDWSGSAICVLVGNGRRFSLHGNTQANMEDGLFDVTIIEEAPATELVEEALLDRVLGTDTADTVRMQAAGLTLAARDGDPITFSLDGEIVQRQQLSLEVLTNALTIPVGEGYTPNPAYEKQ